MIHFPHAKINLGLSVLSRRPDGFHDIETIFYPVPLYDVVEILPANHTSIVVTGLPVPGEPQENLLMRAWLQIKNIRPALPALQILLHKTIPMGAGLGGGSSDAAQLLLMMNSLFDLRLSATELAGAAAALGSDCGFFLQNQACIATGRGEQLEPVSIDLSGYDLLLVHPVMAVSTPWAYGRILPAAPPIPAKQLATLSPQHWRESMVNAFEAPVFAAYPGLARLKSALYQAGAVYAAMSGSGSTLFGLFRSGTCPKEMIDAACSQHLLPLSPFHPVW